MSFIYQILHIKRLNKIDVLLIYHRSAIFSMFWITHKANIIFLYQINPSDSFPDGFFRKRLTGSPDLRTQTVVLLVLHLTSHTATCVPWESRQTQHLATTAPGKPGGYPMTPRLFPITLTALIIPITPRLVSTAPTCAPQMPLNFSCGITAQVPIPG